MTYDLAVWRPRMEAVAKDGIDVCIGNGWSCAACPVGQCKKAATAFLAANPAPQEHKEG